MLAADKPQYLRISSYLGDIDIMRAWYVKQNFSKHTHEGYGLGAILKGVMQFSYRGESLMAYQGSVNSVNPDEPHDGHSLDSETGWCYSMLYFEEDVFRNIYKDMSDKYRTPFLSSGVLEDEYFAKSITELVSGVMSGRSDKLCIESRIIKVLSTAVKRHTDKRPCVKRYKMGNRLDKVLNYIDENLGESISISELACIAQMSPYHFIRSFKNDKGLAPYEYVSMKRTARAKELIISGRKAADAAFECGFTDQSHMNRWLKRIHGITSKNMSSIVL